MPGLRAVLRATLPARLPRPRSLTSWPRGAVRRPRSSSASRLAIVQPGVGTAILGPRRRRGPARGHLWTESLVTHGAARRLLVRHRHQQHVRRPHRAGRAAPCSGSVRSTSILLNGFLLGADPGHDAALRHGRGPPRVRLRAWAARDHADPDHGRRPAWRMGQALVAADDQPRRVVVAPRRPRGPHRCSWAACPGSWCSGVVEAIVSPAPGVPAGLKVALGLGLEASFLLLAWNPRAPVTTRVSAAPTPLAARPAVPPDPRRGGAADAPPLPTASIPPVAIPLALAGGPGAAGPGTLLPRRRHGVPGGRAIRRAHDRRLGRRSGW